MSLNPHWYSTIFGLYVFAGGGLAFIATWILICMALRSKGVLKNTINVEHYHDLGKWLFAMTVFWAYISFLAVPADLVRQSSGRDRLVPLPF